MKKTIKNQKGFTMVELILVITILGILAVAALPQFINVTTQAGDAAMNGVVGAVREGINLQHANNMAAGNDTYPAALGGADGAASAAAPLFTNVITNGITDGRWSQAGNVYTYTPTGGGAASNFTYTPASGTFQ